MAEDWEYGGFGIYVHWPFCAAKCPYCDFNSHVVAHVDQSRWARAYEAEITRVGAETEGRLLRSVFFGGGTPSLMAPETVFAVLEAVRATWTLANKVGRIRMATQLLAMTTPCRLTLSLCLVESIKQSTMAV